MTNKLPTEDEINGVLLVTDSLKEAFIERPCTSNDTDCVECQECRIRHICYYVMNDFKGAL